jgi:hypothetical protein
MLPGKQPQSPFAVLQQTWLEVHLEQSQLCAAGTVLVSRVKTPEYTGAKTPTLRISAAMPPTIRVSHRVFIVISFVRLGDFAAIL